ncbi:MAG: hypothetical protein M0D54_04530 [Hyphomonadaceae bacterium JAD_PAG50586_4]|nr:MAG: hypothetical protein M0D54_04530 [Hyphomonadaceae bacterium JAD_PAG50586_4]
MRAHIQQAWSTALRVCCLSLAFTFLIALGLGDGALAQTPASVRILRGTLVTPSAAATYYGGATTSTNGLCQTFPTNTAICTSNRAPEIVELARSLSNDPDLIYEYVRNRIDTEFMFGLHKGALGAIIDGSGTAFDQAQLMVELLRQAGFSATYQYGTISLNGAQFLAWTGISDARAACDFLASGAIPATVNGGTTCAAGAISNVTLQHIWVRANIGGTNYLFDPAFKDYRHYSGIDVRTVMGVTPGSTLSTATTGMTSGTQSTLNYISTLNQAGVGSSLNTWSTAMLTRLQQSDLQGAALREVIGGREIVAAVRPSGGWRQTSLPYVSGSPASWTGGVPNQYRATLRVVGGVGAVTPFDVTFYSDEIAGRNLGFRSLRTPVARPPGANNWDRWAYTPQLFLDDVVLVAGTSLRVVGPIGLELDLTLTADHPYTSGSGIGADGAFTVAKRVDYLMPSLILMSWGATSADLAAQWDREQGRDEAALIPINPVRSNPDPSQSPDGKGSRMRIAGTWLAQFSRAAEIHGELANARVTQHHNVGVVSAYMRVTLTPVPDGSAPAAWNYSFQDERTLVDIESGYSVTTRNNDATARRGAVHAIAATGSSLEGGVIEQLESAPDASSAVRRLSWGNAPEAGETPNTTSRRVFAVNSTNAAQMANVMVYENQASGNIPPFNNQEGIDAGLTSGPKAAVASSVSAYAAAGFDVTASNEVRLGPGSRMGAVYLWSYSNTTPVYRRGASNQVGGAFVANRYDVNGDPLEIAFVNSSGSQRLKGGGGPSVTQQAEYDPNAAAEVLQGRFQERPPILGVNLTSGSAGFTSPVLQSRGQGAFPYRIEQRLELRGGGLRRLPLGPADVVPVADQDGMVTNWDGAALPSSSGLAAMGQSRAEPAAQTIAAFVAMQDVWRASPSSQREMAGVIAADWWRQSMSFNVATIMQGGQSEEYVRLVNGTFVPSEGGAASFTATGARTPVRPTTQNSCPFNNCSRQYAPTRRWDDHLLQLSARGANGDVRAYQYWGPTTFGAGTGSQQAGFRLNTWTFPQGVTLTLAYNATESGSPLYELPTGVSTNFGQTLTWTRPTEVTICNPLPSITATDLAGAQTRARFRNLVARTVSQRPSGTCDLIELFEPVDTVTPAIRYTYDTANRISEAFDAVAIRTPANRGPYRFNIAQGYRGESVNPILPVGGAYAVETLESGRLRRYIDELGRVTTASMDGRGRLLQRTYPEGDMDLFAYDARDNLTEFRRRAKPTATPALADIVVSAIWNATWNKPDTIIDARGYVTNFAYGSAGAATGQVVTATRPNPNIAAPGTSGVRPIYSYTYGNFGRLATSTDPTGLVVSNTYNASTGYLESSTLDPTGLNATTLFVNNALGDVTATTDPRGNVVETTYDAMRRPRDVLHHNGNIAAPLLAAERTNYDLMGRVLTTQGGTAFSGTTVTTWLTRETRTYTSTGQVWTIADALSNTTTNAYDRADRLESVADPVSRVTRNEYDAAGQLLRIRRAVGTPIEQEYAVYAYTPNGQRDWVEDANDNRSDYVYDGFDRLCRLFFPVTAVGAHAANAPAPTPPTNQLQCNTPTNVGNDYEQYGYDPNSNRVALRVRSGETIGYTFDGLNRETVRDIPGGTSADVYTSYDLAGAVCRRALSAPAGKASSTPMTRPAGCRARRVSAALSPSSMTRPPIASA